MGINSLEPDPAGVRIGIYLLCVVSVIGFAFLTISMFWPSVYEWTRHALISLVKD